jgi:hypothetical protein
MLRKREKDHLHLQFFMRLLVISVEKEKSSHFSFNPAIILPQMSLENLNASHRFVAALNSQNFSSQITSPSSDKS